MSTMSISLRLPSDLAKQLESLSLATGRSKTELTTRALTRFLEIESWQVSEVQQALKEADAGDFASDDELSALDKKWRRSAS